MWTVQRSRLGDLPHGARFTPLTTNPEVIYQFGAWSSDGARFAYASNERDARYFDIYEHALASGQSRLLDWAATTSRRSCPSSSDADR